MSKEQSFDWSKYETIKRTKNPPISTQSNQESFDWSKFEKAPPKESTLMSTARSIYQPISGYAQATTWPADIVKMIGQGEAIGELGDLEERIPELQKQFPQAPWQNYKDIDKEQYMQNVQTAGEYFPTQSNIERGIENITGLPLTAQTTLDKALRLGGTAAGFRGGDFIDSWKLAPGAEARAIEKGVAGITAPVVSEGLQKMGVPEPIAENIGLLGSQFTPIPKSLPTGTTPVIKKSGMPERGFEKITKATKVSEGKYADITSAIETDMRQATDNLFSEASPTYVEMKTNPNFRDERIAGMENVKNLASGLTRKVDSNNVRKEFVKLVNERLKESGGIAQSEFDRELLREARIRLRGIKKDTPVSATQLTEQYRKGNVSRGKLFELGSSTSRNEAKQEAERLLNQSTSNVIQTHYPQTEFAKEILSENKAWSNMEAAESAKGFVDSLFTPEGINFNNAKKLLKDNSQTRNLRRMLGKDKFNQLKEMAKDFVQQGEKYKLLKPGKGVDAVGVGKDLLLLTHHPVLAGGSLLNTGRQFFKGRGLDKVSKNLTYSQVPQNAKTGLAKVVEEAYADFQKP